jgi:hypothetical protein
MNRKRKNREYILNRIIFSQVIILFVLLIILATKKEPSDQAKDIDLSPTNVAEQPLTQDTTTTVSPDAITVQPDEETSLTQEIIITPSFTDPSDLNIDSEVVSDSAIDINDPTAGVEDLEQANVTPTQAPMNASVPAFAQGMSNEFIESLSNTQEGTLIQHTGIRDVTYYAQTDARWAQKNYGEGDTIEEFGCGPTSMSIVISSMTNTPIDPVQMCAWAYEKGYWYSKSGSTHNLIPESSAAFGLKAEGVENNYEAEAKLRTALENGDMVVALMGGGSFTKSGHFIVFCGVNEEGLVYVADPNSEENTNQTWELSQLITDAKPWAGAGGPFWIISN